MPNNPLRNLPSVYELLDSPQLKPLVNRVSRNVLLVRVRSYLDDLKTQVQSAANDMHLPSVSDLAEKIAQRILQGDEPRLRPVINATGILIHDRLGSVPLADEAVEDLVGVARDYASVAMELDSGDHADANQSVEALLRELSGAEAAAVVNNHSAAVVLTLAALAAGRDVIVSRGQLVETDGGDRVHESVAASGAVLREVGSANSTRLDDFAQAIGASTAALMFVQTSNCAVVGATSQVELGELVRLARQRQVPVIHDIGSGGLSDYAKFGLPSEPMAGDSLRAGADLVLLRGDKLLGGPRCGIILGSRELIGRITGHPLMQAVRVDKLTLAALTATLRLHRNPDAAQREIPLLQLLSTAVENLKNRAERLAPQLAACSVVREAESVSGVTYLAGAALPQQQLNTWCIALTPAEGWSVERLAKGLRMGHPAVVGRVDQERLLLDLRSVFPRHDLQLVEAVAALEKRS